jgi:3,4-dihydroxy-2-butanone 4-phosphate synthase
MISVDEGISLLNNGKPVIIFDNENEFEGDVCFPSEKTTPQDILFMSSLCRGVICSTISYNRVDELQIPVLQKKGSSKTGTTNFIIPLDHSESSTGISIDDREMIIKEVVNARNNDKIVWPGHQNFLRVAERGLFDRQGHTETSHYICNVSGYSSATICELVDEKGIPRDLDSVTEFSNQHGIPIVLLSDIVKHHSRRTISSIPNLKITNLREEDNIKGKRFIVTGSSSGIGKSVCKMIRKNGGETFEISRSNNLDLLDLEGIKKALEKYYFDGVIHCAGYLEPGNILDNVDDFEQSMKINCSSILHILSYIKGFLSHEAPVIFVSSNAIYSENKKKDWCYYTASKQALSTCLEYLSHEEQDFLFYEVSPSKTYTPMLKRMYPDINPSDCMTPEGVANFIINLINQII